MSDYMRRERYKATRNNGNDQWRKDMQARSDLKKVLEQVRDDYSRADQPKWTRYSWTGVE